MADIGTELLEKIRDDFNKSCKADKFIQKVLADVDNGSASLEDISLLSRQLGFRLSTSISAYIKPENLPDGRLYYNIAYTILTGTLKDNHEIINSVATEVQKAIDRKTNINIKPQKAAFPAERVNALVSSVSAEGANQEVIKRRLDAPVRNITESFYNDYVKTNAEFRSKSGLKTYITRKTSGGCCKWCSELAGRYEYPDDVPDDIYRRHDNCTCTVTYENGRQRQDVWSKKTWSADEQTLERRRELSKQKPTVLTKEQASKKEIEVAQRAKAAVDNSKESGIIKIGMQYFAKIPEEKFTNYALDPVRQPDKARAFKEALGYTLDNYQDLIKNISDNFNEKSMVLKGTNKYGNRYELVMRLTGANGKTANVCTGWFKETQDSEPRLTSAYVTKKKVT